MKFREKISWLMGRLQQQLFPCLEECSISPLTEQEKYLVQILELIKIENHIHFNRQWMGRSPAKRKAISRCFVAKAVFRYPSPRSLRVNRVRVNLNLYFRRFKRFPFVFVFRRLPSR
ncbi:MAG: hypothetical protein V2I36_07890 [Desulfopila sp.]|jgi:hypothetical protein|nr:hypothetical protein [Desulfopila sp.]